MKTTALQPDRVFRALSDKTRLRILHMLLRGELCVCDIVAVLGSPQPTVSRHLAYLRRTGLVKVRKQGVWCYYQLAPAVTTFDSALRKCIECCSTQPQLARDAAQLEVCRSTCCD